MKKFMVVFIVSILALSLVLASENLSDDSSGRNKTISVNKSKIVDKIVEVNKGKPLWNNKTGRGNMTRDEIKEQIKERVRERIAEMNKTRNATFGNCVVDSVVIRQGCYESAKDALVLCRNVSIEGSSNGTVKDCLAVYKSEMAVCKQDFKDAKGICAENVKPKFFEKMRYALS
jgi:hypothetical protein